jgi:hypothetical protein
MGASDTVQMVAGGVIEIRSRLGVGEQEVAVIADRFTALNRLPDVRADLAPGLGKGNEGFALVRFLGRFGGQRPVDASLELAGSTDAAAFDKGVEPTQQGAPVHGDSRRQKSRFQVGYPHPLGVRRDLAFYLP